MGKYQAQAIDPQAYRMSGEGANGTSYDSMTDDDMMVKLYNESYPINAIKAELEAARKVFRLGIPSPEPGELVTDGKRYGISFKKIAGKRSYSRMIADEPQRTEELTREFARFFRQLHARTCEPGFFPDARRQFLQMLEADRIFNDAEKQKIADFIESVPYTPNLLHGDMHIGNVISTLPKGAPLSAPHDIFFIDLGYFSQGNPLFDLGMMRIICKTSHNDFLIPNMHINSNHANNVWEYFVDEYFQGTKNPAEADELVCPYEAVKLLLVDYNLGDQRMDEHYISFIRETLL